MKLNLPCPLEKASLVSCKVVELLANPKPTDVFIIDGNLVCNRDELDLMVALYKVAVKKP